VRGINELLEESGLPVHDQAILDLSLRKEILKRGVL